jgi:CRP-like cAMP-binding protein
MSPSWSAAGMDRFAKFLLGLMPMRMLTEIGGGLDTIGTTGAAYHPAVCAQCPVRHHGICQQIGTGPQIGGQDIERQFRQSVRIAKWRAGDPIFHQGEACGSVFTIQSGWVLTYKVFEDGRRQIIRFALPGDLIGIEGDTVSGMAYGAEALTDVKLCGIKHSVFLGLCARSSQLAMNYASALSREAMAAWNHIGALGQQPAQGRIANLLLELHQRLTARGGVEGVAVSLPLSQVHIADATGLTAVHVCRTLKRMRQEGLLDLQKGRLVLLDQQRLAEIAQLDLPEPPMAAA